MKEIYEYVAILHWHMIINKYFIDHYSFDSLTCTCICIYKTGMGSRSLLASIIIQQPTTFQQICCIQATQTVERWKLCFSLKATSVTEKTRLQTKATKHPGFAIKKKRNFQSLLVRKKNTCTDQSNHLWATQCYHGF